MNAIEEWTAAQRRVIDLVSGLSPEQAEARVPACPDWTVRDLFSHMVGLGSDVVVGDEPDDHNAEWTARQVATRRDHDVAALAGDAWSCGDPDAAAVVVRASDFYLARALVTRRSEAQLRDWTVRGDVGPYLDAFALLGTLPSADLAE